jgi:hypothetical protein
LLAARSIPEASTFDKLRSNAVLVGALVAALICAILIAMVLMRLRRARR